MHCYLLFKTVIKVSLGLSRVFISYPLNRRWTHNHSRERPLGYYCYNMTHHMTTSQSNPNVTLSADENRWQEHSRNDPIKQGRRERSIQPVFLWQSMVMHCNPRRMTPRGERWKEGGRGRRRRKRGRRGSSQAALKQLVLHLTKTCWAYVIPGALFAVQFRQNTIYILSVTDAVNKKYPF